MKNRGGLVTDNPVNDGQKSLHLHESGGTTVEVFVMKTEEQPLVRID